LDSTVGILIVLRGRFLNRVYFLLGGSDVGCDGVLRNHDVCRCGFAPVNRIAQLLRMFLHGLGCALDSSARRPGRIA
jgi:hypothetical protein